MKNSYAEKTESELRAMLGSALLQGANAVYNASVILAEMFERKINLPHYQDPVLRWFRQIANGSLSPRFVQTFSSTPDIITAAVGFPLTEQEKWADGYEITIAEINAAGQVVARPKRLVAFTKYDLAVAFDGAKIRHIEAQEEIVRNKTAKIIPIRPAAKPRITSPRPEFIKVSHAGEYRIGELSDALFAAGYERPRKRQMASTETQH